MQTFLRRLAILDYLKRVRTAKSTQDILYHLTATGYLLDDLEPKSLQRVVQRDLVFLRGGPLNGEADNEFGLDVTPGVRRALLWQMEPYGLQSFDFEKMPKFLALAFSMVRKHLISIMPQNTVAELTAFFDHAEEKLALSENSLSPENYRRLKESIEFFQRGQRLQAAPINPETLDTIYRAIVKNRQVQFRYRSKDYCVHPLGVAILLPKLYLIGTKVNGVDESTPVSRSGTGVRVEYRNFLIHKIEDIYLSQNAAEIPDGFSLKQYLDEGHMDVLVDYRDTERYTLRLHLTIPSGRRGLLDDLRDSPISVDQIIAERETVHKQDGLEAYCLTATVRRTVQLRNWLLSLGSVATVIEPHVIREDLLATVRDLQRNYERD
ncbi:transcriptional regulator [Oleiphilus messinensis]|uniref:Transcriptional regulator n=1 Tax=Oleiphilus messinensis TaxID=141451 RepID=A0A1Y0IDK9_9GAMM|nr:WYL domain-containing protein [Oleiphilus messinensis]ARU57866.1 transcriptional regulator [Oleiphilus messinensis]